MFNIQTRSPYQNASFLHKESDVANPLASNNQKDTQSKLFNVPQYIKCSALPLQTIHGKILYTLDARTPQIKNTS